MNQDNCRNHPELVATWKCDGCGNAFCDDCTNIQKVGAVELRTCRICGEKCERIIVSGSAEETARRPRSFLSLVPGAFAFPLVGGGMGFLVAGALFFGALKLIGFVGGIFGYVVACIVLLVLLGLRTAGAFLFGLMSVPVVGILLNGIAAFYFLIVQMRVLGLLYRSYAARLAWFENL